MTMTIREIIANEIKSDLLILNKSPIKYVENLLNEPPEDIIISPRAIAVEEKTPITVSAPVLVRFLM